jgi:hypothetical protein
VNVFNRMISVPVIMAVVATATIFETKHMHLKVTAVGNNGIRILRVIGIGIGIVSASG